MPIGNIRGIARGVQAARGTSPTSGGPRSFGGTRFRPIGGGCGGRFSNATQRALAQAVTQGDRATGPTPATGNLGALAARTLAGAKQVPQQGGIAGFIQRGGVQRLLAGETSPEQGGIVSPPQAGAPRGGVSGPGGIARPITAGREETPAGISAVSQFRGGVEVQPTVEEETPAQGGGRFSNAIQQRLAQELTQRAVPPPQLDVPQEEAPPTDAFRTSRLTRGLGGGRFSNAVQERLAQELAPPPQAEVPQAEAPQDLQQALLNRLSGGGIRGLGGRLGGSFQETMARILQAQRQGPFIESQVRNRLRSRGGFR